MGSSTTANNLGNGTNNLQGMDSKSGTGQDSTTNLRETVDRAADAASSTASRLGERAQDAISDLSENASQYASRFAETRDQFMDDARDYITANPFRTIGIAALTGFVLGRMMR